MHFSNIRLASITLFLLSPLAVRAVEFTDLDIPLLSYGQTFVLTCAGSNGLTSIGLATGPADDLTQYLAIMPSGGVEGTSYIWHFIPSSIPAGEYAFTITSAGAENYSKLFCIEKCPTASTTTPDATTTSAVATLKTSSSCTTTTGSTMVPYPARTGNGTSEYAASATGGDSTGEGSVVSFTGGAQKVGVCAMGGVIAAGALGAVAMMM